MRSSLARLSSTARSQSRLLASLRLLQRSRLLPVVVLKAKELREDDVVLQDVAEDAVVAVAAVLVVEAAK